MSAVIDRFVVRCRHSLMRAILRITERFPEEDPRDVAFRLRRAVASIPSSIGDGTTPASAALLDRAQSATAEVKYLLTLSDELGYAGDEELASLTSRVSMLRQMVQHVRSRGQRGAPPAWAHRAPNTTSSNPSSSDGAA
jgi:four helix bundle protein